MNPQLIQNHLKEYLSSLHILNEDEINWGSSFFKIIILKKSDFFIKQDEPCLLLGFIAKGMVKAYSVDHYGKENIYCFGIENDFVTILTSFQNKTLSTKNIQAIEDSLLLTITLENLNLLIKKSTNWEKVAQHIIQKEYLEKERFLQLFHHQSANLKFRNLIKFYPFLLTRAKTEDIASFIGITTRTLNRAKLHFYQKE
ncbi:MULTISPECIES: Crp/Fnr family transcriptional regulator [Flavobacterium]|uniref:Crp/Fnr family transcriptional regulator n=2 Tax=Flavobacterium TaxID=237 RepID=A0AA94F0F4_9FLAO|nr:MULTISPECIES: cyclic nucleotide-binding domain-containing protein [Flavobacterium]AMA49313.1 hypothetical protein AWN65_07525 [Flavobacterium covae]AND63013.1 hypothetical protein AX766_00550 [Flavobacterium covae]MCH4828569.1 Crp/Fnr family transcriptional regulator [Flavobacterium columnare]MCH4831822.1 Crp/Fnr family transcriptional regulator [Flavobacterium columnare]MCJ1806815.1 cyclic nucleotide-binding domain-containing protein [Flavobacterium covae]